MSMLKKTIPLTHCKDMGMLTVVKVGSSVGFKLVLNEVPIENLYLAVKIGCQKEFVKMINEMQSEFEMEADILSSDPIGVIILTENGGIYAAGGRRELVNIKNVKNEICKIDAPIIEIEQPKPDVTELATSSPQEFDEPPAEATETPNKAHKSDDFYRKTKERLDELFTIYPRDDNLTAIIPDSEWVKVSYDGGDYYLVGLLREGEKVTHIGYGIPGEAKIKPPKEVADMCDFLPMPGNPETGWWLMFQSPDDGTMILN